MKRFVIILLLLSAVRSHSQVSINLQLPPAGLSLKSQLWNLFVNNSTTAGIQIHTELRLTEASSNAEVMTAVTNIVTVSPGNQFLNAGTWSPVQYNFTNPSYQGFAATDFLPAGRFLACYTLVLHNLHNTQKIMEDCEIVEIEPLSPPHLVYPANQEVLKEDNPVFNWVGPAPMNLFTSLNFDLEVVEILPGQTESDAIEQNIPLFNQGRLNNTSYPYSAGAPSLQKGKKYAWRILAKNNDAVVGTSETWWFTRKDDSYKTTLSDELAFVKLKKDNQLSYGVAVNDLKFEYLNETADTLWNIKIVDVGKTGRQEMSLPMDSIPLRRGQNLVRIPAKQMESFVDKHLYLLQLRNSRDELWQLKFEYRRHENE